MDKCSVGILIYLVKLHPLLYLYVQCLECLISNFNLRWNRLYIDGKKREHSHYLAYIQSRPFSCSTPRKRKFSGWLNKRDHPFMSLEKLSISFLYTICNQTTLESGIDVKQGINIGHGKFVKKNKHRALNKRSAWKFTKKNRHKTWKYL